MAQAIDKPRYVLLDGLRGVAALIVAWLHATQISGNPGYWRGSASLAVDFFFCLSGFVVAHAYEKRLRGDMSLSAFMQRRLVRLYPMIAIGVLLSLALSSITGNASLATDLDALLGLAMIPVGLFRHSMLYPINPPMWSLFFELFACVAFAVAVKHVPARLWLPAIAIIGAVLAVLTAWRGLPFLGSFGSLSFLGGFPRSLYPILLGATIWRLGWHERVRAIPPLAAVAGLVAVLAVPFGRHWQFEIVAALFLLPALVTVSANAKVQLDRTWKLFGDLSYPLYLVHWPVLKAVHALIGGWAPPLVEMASGMAIAVLVAWGALRLLDEPARERLRITAPAKA